MRTDTASRGGRIVFAAGLAVYLLVQVGLIGVANHRRVVPVEADDAYVHILRAEQMRTCFRQDCPALEDLRAGLLGTPGGTPTPSLLLSIAYNRTFGVHTPLYSGLLVGAHGLGASWETAHDIISMLGATFIGVAFGLWLLALWGPGSAGIALGILAFTVFSGQGVLYVVPSNLTLAIGVMTWAAIVHSRDRPAGIVLFGILAMLAMHPIGKAYAVVTLLWYVLIVETPISKKTWLVVVSGLFMIGVASGLPYLVERPEMLLFPSPLPDGWSVWSGIVGNLYGATRIVAKWLLLNQFYVIDASLVLLGFLLSPLSQRRKIGITGGTLTLLLLASLFHLLPGYRAEVFSRFWLAVAVLLTGAMGHAVWLGVLSALDHVRDLRSDEGSAAPDQTTFASGNRWTTAFFLASVLVLAQWALNHAVLGSLALGEQLQYMSEYQDMEFDPSQPELITRESPSCGNILYMNLTLMHFFFAHGTLQCGAILNPFLGAPPKAARQNLDYAVAWNPTLLVALANRAGYRKGGILLSDDSEIEYSNDEKLRTPHSCRLKLANPGRRADLRWIWIFDGEPKGDEPTVIPVEATWSGWRECPTLPESDVSGFRLLAPDDETQVLLQGIRLSEESSLNWPWEHGGNLDYRSPDGYTEAGAIRFEVTELTPFEANSGQVLSDSGSSVLIRFDRQ